MSPAGAFDRRALIRRTWQTLYEHKKFDTRFFVSRPKNATVMSNIKQENATFQDIILLEDIPENTKTAKTIKPIYFFKYLISQYGDQLPWKFVSKMDSDSFLHAENYYQNYLVPLAPSSSSAAPPTLIARLLPPKFKGDISPGGQIYTLTSDLITAVVKQWDKQAVNNLHEDRLLGMLLRSWGGKYDLVELSKNVAMDFGLEYWPNEDTVEVHRLKSPEVYEGVAALFDEKGWKGGGM